MQDSPDNVLQPDWLDDIKWTEYGLVPAIAQDADNGDILMMAWMNRESLALTVQEGQAVYWSRSRGKLWRKGESSGHQQVLRDIRLDRSEEHTSELQSRPHLVCRLLLEKKNKNHITKTMRHDTY